jgi:hypothetical protein
MRRLHHLLHWELMTTTVEWPQLLDAQIVKAINSGQLLGPLHGREPDRYLETGLAHIFFYGDTVYKLYKTHHDAEHFIYGVLAPNQRRVDFLHHDFATNQHFSQGTYRKLYSVVSEGNALRQTEYTDTAIHTLIEMERLDFSSNLHERLLRREVNHQELFLVGRELARLMDEHTIVVPTDITWYSQAKGRMRFLRQFVGWLPDSYTTHAGIQRSLDALDNHLEQHREEYLSLSGSQLCADLDNHDENIFIINGQVLVIDTIPPMDCWWYGVPESNLTAVMVNVEALLSAQHAARIKDGYDNYHGQSTTRENIFEFTRAFNYLISIAHFGATEDKQAVAEKYLLKIADLPERLQTI